MPLKRHHKIIIGSFSTLLLLAIIGSIVILFINQTIYYQNLNDRLDESSADTQTKFNELTNNLIETRSSLQNISSEIGSMNKEFELLKASTSADFSGIIEQSVKGVVTIKTNSAQGTGFIISSDGYVITNAHVLADSRGYLASDIIAITYNQESIAAKFIGYSSDFDLALLKISGNYEELKLGNSDDVQVGEKVIAIGNPLGLQFSVTEGIVSAIHRPGVNKQEVYIQTDAALNPGNSGGPLINKQGKVIGINNFKIGSGESLGFALESNYIEDVVNEISNQALNQSLI
jgi:serine protease Do